MSWEEALQGAVLTDKTDVDVWSCVTLTRDIKQRPRIICMPIIMRNLWHQNSFFLVYNAQKKLLSIILQRSLLQRSPLWRRSSLLQRRSLLWKSMLLRRVVDTNTTWWRWTKVGVKPRRIVQRKVMDILLSFEMLSHKKRWTPISKALAVSECFVVYKWLFFTSYFMSTRVTPNRSKKLRYRDQHSASVVLGWCIVTFLGRKSVDG